MTLFFGGGSMNVENLEIEGEKLSTFICDLFNDIGKQNKSLSTLLFGAGFLNYNITSFNKKVNLKLKKYIEYSGYFVKSRLEELKEGKTSLEG